MTWGFIAAFAIGTYLIRLAGLMVPESILPSWLTSLTRVLPAAILAALIAVQTFGAPERMLTLDARVLGVGVALILALRLMPVGVVMLAGMGVTALARAFLGMA